MELTCYLYMYHRRGGVEVERSPRMRVRSPVATDISRKNR